MKMLFRSSNKRIILTLLVLVMGVVVVRHYFFAEVIDGEIAYHHHQSRLAEYAPLVEKAVLSKPLSLIDLEHVVGMVLPHDIPTTIPRLAEYYFRLKQAQVVDKVIIIGPDHTDAGLASVTVSNAIFHTAFGALGPIAGLAQELENSQLAYIDESPFVEEHSVNSQIMLISRIFPNAKVTPILLRSDVSKAHAIILGQKIAEFMDDKTVLVASIDFSHYLSTDQAKPLDQISGEVIRNLQIEALSLVKADSNASVATFIKVMKQKQVMETDHFEVLNTNDFMQNSDNTTGYVFGCWGI